MRCGISTACFFPGSTLDAMAWLAARRVPVIELFFNTFSELEDPYLARLLALQQAGGVRVASVHPFTAMIEGFFFASEYKSRLADGIAFYRRYFEVCNLFGADRLVFHGDYTHNMGRFSLEDYAANFRLLAEAGREYGVTLCQENVAYCRCPDAVSTAALRPLLGEYGAFVLDVKQTRRRGTALYALMEAMAGGIRQVHISDHTAACECLPPGRGDMDYAPFIDKLRQQRYDGDLIIELYRDNYGRPEELLEAMRHVQGQIDKAERGNTNEMPVLR